MKLNKSQEQLMTILGKNPKGITPKLIALKVEFSSRTICYNLRKLLRRGLVKRVTDLSDTRQYFYVLVG